jgi:hypothetical protein
MGSEDWVSLGEYSEIPSAEIVSRRLMMEGIRNRVVSDRWGPLSYPRSGPCYIWVPPESVDDAKRILAETAMPDSELASLALKYPPPDDV